MKGWYVVKLWERTPRAQWRTSRKQHESLRVHNSCMGFPNVIHSFVAIRSLFTARCYAERGIAPIVAILNRISW